MSIISFTGTVSTNLWVNDSVSPGSSSDPPIPGGYPYNTTGSIKSYNPYDTVIVWNNTPPAIINGQSINGIEKILFQQSGGENNYNIATTYVFTISGTQGGFGAQINIALFDPPNSPITADNVQALDQCSFGCEQDNTNFYCKNNTCPTFTYNLKPLIAGFKPFLVQVNPWNQAGPNWTVNNFNVTVIMTVTLNLFCSGISLNTEICTQACETSENLKNGLCFQNYLNYCFSPSGTTGATGPVIFENGGDNICNTYFESYLGTQGPGPNFQTDQELSKACLFITDLDQFNGQTGGIQTICACHIDQTFYQNIENSINSLPGGKVVDVPAVCLFPPCVSSVYKPNITGKTCPVIPCINIADIENNGTVQGGTTINQSCLQSSNTSITNYLIFIIPAGIIILVVIIVVLVLIFKAI